MSLVAYGSSDESENEEQESSHLPESISKPTLTENKLRDEQKSLQQSDENPLNNNNITKENEDNSRKNTLFSSIPPPKSNSSLIEVKSNDQGTKKTTVKISVPSLSTFKDDDVEEEPTKKKLKPSVKGSGLFALLPAPRNVFLKTTKSSDGSKTQAPLIPRSVNKPPPVIPKKYLKPDEDSVPEEKNEGPLDFFSLSSLNDVPDDVPDDSLGDLNGTNISSSLHLPPPRNWGSSLTEQSSQNGTLGMASSSDIPVEPEENDFIPVDNSNVQLTEEALEALCGRRAKRQQEEVEIIDVSGAELLPDPKEWLIKQFTEEKKLPSRGFGRRHDGPTSQQRRKHQITYLAFQAKENELELKNQWSQNRMSRKQTQSKYGF